LLTTAEAGAVEFLTDKWYPTITTGAARKEFTLNDIALTSGRVPFSTTNGRLTDSSVLTYNSGTSTMTVTNLTVIGTLVGGGAAAGASVTVDFGYVSGEEVDSVTTTVAAAWVAAGTKLVCQPFAVATAEHDPDDYAAEEITAYCTNIVAGVGFDVIAFAPNGSFGKYVIHIIGV
jgi:hypothetical protein